MEIFMNEIKVEKERKKNGKIEESREKQEERR